MLGGQPRGLRLGRRGGTIVAMDTPLRLGVIGCGGFTAGKHLPNIVANPRLALAVLCDRDPAVLAALARRHPGVRTGTDFAAVCADPGVDAVLIGTKPSFRLPIMAAAVAAGKPILVEKPLSMRADEALAMLRLVRRPGVRFMVGHNRPYSPIMRDARALFHRARQGRTTITYRIVGEAQLWPEHHRSAILGGESTILHELTHVFDLLMWLLDAEPGSVSVRGGGSMDNVLTLEFPGDTTAVIIAGDNGSSGFPKERLEIATNHAVIEARSFIELRWAGACIGGGRRTYPYHVAGAEVTSNYAEYEDRLWEARAGITAVEREHGYYYHRLPVEDKGHIGELDAFYELARHGTPAAADARRSALSTLIALEAIAAHASGRTHALRFPALDEAQEQEAAHAR